MQLPGVIHRLSERIKTIFQDKRRSKMTAKEIFREIYSKKLWGYSSKEFFSGFGSEEKAVVQPYMLANISGLTLCLS